MAHVEARLTVRAIRPLVSGFRQLGHEPSAVFRAAGIDEALLQDPDARVPASVAARWFAHAVELTGDTNLGLHLAQQCELTSVDVHFYAMASSATLGVAYERLCRYQRLIHDTNRVELEVADDRAVLRHRLAGGRPVPRHTAEFLLTAWVRAGRVVTGVDWAPLEVHFAHPTPRDVSEHVRFFRASIQFTAGENALVIPAALLKTPCVGADPALVAVLDRYAADRIEQAPRTSSVADRVRSVLVDELRGGEPSASRLARRLKMSVRTLNRLLAVERTSYRELLDTLRRDLAVRHLTDDGASIAEVGFLLGFSEISSFHRAFKRWTGLTPARFRQQSRSRDR